MRKLTKLLLIAYASPNSLLGIFMGLLGLASGGRWQIQDGCLEFHGGFVKWFLRHLPPGSRGPGMGAMTLGHTIIGQSSEMLNRARRHEHIHVQQYEIWGPLFLPAYLGCSALLWIGGRNPYMDNPFEIEAYNKVDRQA